MKLNKEKEKRKSIKNSKRSITFNLVEMIVSLIVVSLIVAVLTGFLVYKNYNYIYDQTNSVETSKELKEFTKVYNELKEKYIEDIDDEKLIDSAIEGMLNYLDIYTNYLDTDETMDLQDRLSGEYKGIGVEITNNQDGNVEIVTVFENSPASNAGLKAGDVIVAINDKNMLGKLSSEVANEIKVEVQDSYIDLTYKRNEVEKTTVVSISNVVIPSVEYEIKEKNIGYVKITTFSNTTYIQLKNTLQELEKKNIKSLIIDVRNNSGGYLSSARETSDLFLEKGKIIYKTQDKEGIVGTNKAVDNDKTTYPIVVLVNEFSASASEILAAALNESYGATLIGVRTYGKGTIQQTEELSDGSMIKFTTSYWLTPSGKNINGVGIEPDIYITNTNEKDVQLEKAIETLR